MDDLTTDEMAAEARARARVREVPAADIVAWHARGDDVVYLDVREPNEWNLFRIPGAVHLPLGGVRARAPEAVAATRRVVVYCQRGNRSLVAADALQELGYADVVSLEGGLMAWVSAGGALED
jgi:rhodanese-related sulfurtransferase